MRFVVADPSIAQHILRTVKRWPAVAAAQAAAGRATPPDDLRWQTKGAPVLVVQGLVCPES